MVPVIMDGKEILVPERVGSWEAVLEVLRVPPGKTVATKAENGWVLLGRHTEDTPGTNVRWWDFHEHDVYKSIAIDELPDDHEPGSQIPWEDDGESWKPKGWTPS